MDAVAALHEIPLNRLVLSPANARKTPASATDDAELKASIAAHGLKQNLIVGRADAEGRHAVIAGGRRLRALLALSADGLIPPDRPVPCLIEAPDSALETSLVENAVRVAMHPADQFEAFAALVDAGQTIAAIAARFGVAERLVRQRLRLGKVAPDLLAAYRNGQMDLETLTAFTLSDDLDAQRAVWAEASQHYGRSPIQIRRRLTETAIPVASRLGRFVGIEAYQAAGGTITRDLFCDHDQGFMDDATLVRRLAQAKLDAEAAALAPDWKWARPVLDPVLGVAADYGRIEPTPAEPSPDLRALLDDLARREDDLANVAAEDWSAEHEAEAEDLAARQEEVDRTLAAQATFAEADRRRAGCLVTIGPDGRLRVLQGLIDPADRIAKDDGAADEPAKVRGFSQALIDDLKAHPPEQGHPGSRFSRCYQDCSLIWQTVKMNALVGAPFGRTIVLCSRMKAAASLLFSMASSRVTGGSRPSHIQSSLAPKRPGLHIPPSTHMTRMSRRLASWQRS
jgi:ParB family chromosome partitioning protein